MTKTGMYDVIVTHVHSSAKIARAQHTTNKTLTGWRHSEACELRRVLRKTGMKHARSFLPNPPLSNAHMGKNGLTFCSASPHRRSW